MADVFWQYVKQDGTPAQRTPNVPLQEPFAEGVDPNGDGSIFFPGGEDGWFRQIVEDPDPEIPQPLIQTLQAATTVGTRANGSPATFLGAPDDADDFIWRRRNVVAAMPVGAARSRVRNKLDEEIGKYRERGINTAFNSGPDAVIAIDLKFAIHLGLYLLRHTSMLDLGMEYADRPFSLVVDGREVTLNPRRARKLFVRMFGRIMRSAGYELDIKRQVEAATLEDLQTINDSIDPDAGIGNEEDVTP